MEPIRLVSGKLQELRHLRVMSERIKPPTHFHIHTERVAVISFAVENLPDPRLPAWHVDVEHYVVATNNLQPTFLHILAESRGLLRISLQEWTDICNLIEHKSIFGMGS